MKIRKLNKAEFSFALERGLGRALLHVQAYGDDGVENELIHATVTNLVFDSQIDDGRAWWLVQMLAHCKNMGRYIAEIKRAILAEDIGGRDFKQLLGLCVLLFEQGFSEFRDTVSSINPTNLDSGSLVDLACALVDLNGLTGLKQGAILLQKPDESDTWMLSFLFDYACEEHGGSKRVKRYLEGEAVNDSVVANFLNVVERERDERFLRRRDRAQPTLKQILECIESDAFSCPARLFGKYATEDELITILEHFEDENDQRKQCRLLSVFAARAMPAVSVKVKRLLTSDDRNIRLAVRNALRIVKSPEIRDLALELICTGGDENISHGLNLLELNFRSQDVGAVTECLESVQDMNYIHWSGSAIVEICKGDAEARLLSQCLISICERNPCAMCRCNALERLAAIGEAPFEMLFETQWDADQPNRLLARGACSKFA